MIHYGAKELAAAFRLVRSNTIQIAEDLPEEQYAFKAAHEARSVGRLLAHIALGPTLQRHVHANKIDDLKMVNFSEHVQRMQAEEATPRTKAEIIALLKRDGEAFAEYLESLSDSFLGEQVSMPPGAQPAAKSRFEMLMSVKEHEMHHRGQLMLIERLLGIVPHLTRRMQERFAQAQR